MLSICKDKLIYLGITIFNLQFNKRVLKMTQLNFSVNIFDVQSNIFQF
jgi:hypothetical protein